MDWMRVAILAVVAGCGFSPSSPTGASDAAPSDGAADAPSSTTVDAKLDDAALPRTDDLADLADTFLASDTPTTNYTTQSSALADGDVVRVALFRFDTSAIATSAVVTAAELHIWTDFDPGDTCTFHQVLEAWDDATATWNERSTGVAWTNLGAGPPASRATVAVGTVDPTVAATGYVVTIDPAVVATWVATPATNFGLAIATTQANGTRFTTRESSTTAAHAFLRVTHAP
jgi:hypothetical protein